MGVSLVELYTGGGDYKLKVEKQNVNISTIHRLIERLFLYHLLYFTVCPQHHVNQEQLFSNVIKINNLFNHHCVTLCISQPHRQLIN